MGRKILFITTDQQRYDTLGCNGGALARTPVVDALAARGIRYERAIPQSVVCMPSRSTMLTGQHVSTHGVWMNGVALPEDAPSVAATLLGAGYRTALVGKPHFQPFLDPFARFTENQLSAKGVTAVESIGPDGRLGPHRGFEHLEFAAHAPVGSLHYARWMTDHHPEAVGGFYQVLDRDLEVNADGGGDTGAPQVKVNPVERDWYHTDWVADRTIAWLDGLDASDDWFCWMSFPDPHHPWDPPQSELGRVDWRDVPLPAGYVESPGERERLLDGKPRHWRLWYDGDLVSNYEAPTRWVPATMTADMVREINAVNAVEVELIDEAVGRVLAAVAAKGWADDLDVVFTTDHGELQGDFGLMFKGPYHVDGLMRLPLIWRPAPSAGVTSAAVTRPVELVDLAPTFCEIAGLDAEPWMQGQTLPVDDGDADARGFERALTEWDSELLGVAVHLRTITRDGWVCTTYAPGTVHDGTEGELYALADDPLQQVNRWNDPGCAQIQSDLISDLLDHLPPIRAPKLPRRSPRLIPEAPGGGVPLGRRGHAWDMPITEEIIDLERRGWEALATDGAAATAFYEEVLDDEPIVLLPGGMVVKDRGAIVDSMSGAAWARYDLEDVDARPLGDDAATVTYGVVAERDGAEPYSALIASTYVRRPDGWRLALHQQTQR